VWRWPGGAVALAAAGLVLAAVVGAMRPAYSAVDHDVADLGKYPFFTMITAGTSSCAGTVVAPDWVLTTAQCMQDGAPEGVWLYLTNGRFVQAAEVITHPLFDGLPRNGHDLALLRTPAGSTTGITPPQVGSAWSEEPYTPERPALRLGSTGREGDSGGHLIRAVPMTIRADDAVRLDYQRSYAAPQRWVGELSIAAQRTDAALCPRERGDPLMVERDGRTIVIGVGSFTVPDCAMPQSFGELSGSQLAWVAAHAPAVVSGWGPCTADGRPGVPGASYGDTQLRPEERTEGPWWWSITCVARPLA
jgi:trypsin